MYESLERFAKDARACGREFYTDDSLDDPKIAAAYKIYRRARAGTELADFDGNPVEFGVTIVGRLALRDRDGEWMPSSEDFPSIDEIMKENLTTLGEEDGSRGSILSAKDWSLLANDAWLLGGIQAGTEFHFASPLSWENLWRPGAGGMTVTAREAISIAACGYRIIRPNPSLEAVAVPADPARARQSSLPSLKSALLEYAGAEGLKRFYLSIPEAARRYP